MQALMNAEVAENAFFFKNYDICDIYDLLILYYIALLHLGR